MLTQAFEKRELSRYISLESLETINAVPRYINDLPYTSACEEVKVAPGSFHQGYN